METNKLKEYLGNDFIAIPPEKAKYILLIEDGSVDIEKLDLLGIDYLVYRIGSQKPELVKIGE